MAEIRQAIFEKLHEIEDQLAVRFSRGATIYINPTDGCGQDIVPRGELGEEVKKLVSKGPYRSAADELKM